MANPSSYDDTLVWVNKLTTEISACKYGRNSRSITDGIAEQRSKVTLIKNNEDKVKLLLSRTREADKKVALETAFNNMKMVGEKKIHCLETMLSVTSLEDNCAHLSRDLDEQAVRLVREIQHPGPTSKLTNRKQEGDHLAGFIATAAQDCIFGLRDNWDWITKLVHCVDIHLKNGADYHQFFHEVEESEEWLHDDLEKIAQRFETSQIKGDEEDAQLLAAELDETYVYLRQWEAKTNRLWDTATKLVPVPRRTDGSREPTPARSLCDYETSQISLRSNEDILLLDNTKPKMWKVRNGKGEEAEVPALTVLIPGPDKQAIEAAVNMRLRLLTTWTNALKKIGKKLIFYMLHVFKPEYKAEEIASITSIKDLDKSKMLQILNLIEDGLKRHWSDHEGFINLQERILALRMILEEFGDGQPTDEKLTQKLVLQVNALGEIIKIYQDLFKDWELYKVSVEASRAPELMLIVDKWEQLQFVTREFFSQFWKSKLPLDEREKSILQQNNFILDGVQYEDFIQYEDTVDSQPQRNPLIALESVTSDEQGRTFTANITSTNFATSVPSDFGNNKQQNQSSGFSQIRTVTTTSGEVKEEETTVDGRKITRVQPIVNVSDDRYGRAQTSSTSMQSTVTQSNQNYDRATLHDNNDKGNTNQGMFETVTRTEVISGGSGHQGNSASGGTVWSQTTTSSSSTSMGSQSKGGSTGVTSNDRGSSGESSSGQGSYETTTRTETKSDGRSSGAATNVPKQVLRPQVVDSTVQEEGFEEIKEINIRGVKVGEHMGTDFGMATERKTAETEQLCSAEMEERKTFVIRSVINPTDQSDISLQQAILLGVICPNSGTYVNTATGEVIPLATAMSDGLIKVVYTTVKRSPEKTSSIGIITVKTIREIARQYTILSIKDTARGDSVSQQEAVKRGIIDEQRGLFLDRRTQKRMLIPEAAELGLMEIEYLGDPPGEPEVISKIYAVRAVVDRRQKKTVTFQDAIRAGIIDKESGAYRDNLTGEKMYVGDAIMRGFLKARLLESSFGMNIDPENRMVIDKTDIIRKNLLRPLGVISAFKRAAKEGALKK